MKKLYLEAWQYKNPDIQYSDNNGDQRTQKAQSPARMLCVQSLLRIGTGDRLEFFNSNSQTSWCSRYSRRRSRQRWLAAISTTAPRGAEKRHLSLHQAKTLQALSPPMAPQLLLDLSMLAKESIQSGKGVGWSRKLWFSASNYTCWLPRTRLSVEARKTFYLGPLRWLLPNLVATFTRPQSIQHHLFHLTKHIKRMANEI